MKFNSNSSPFQPSAAIHIETNHLFYRAKTNDWFLYAGMRVKIVTFPGKICRIFYAFGSEVTSAAGEVPWKLELYSSLTGSKQHLSTGKTNTQYHKNISMAR